jgi:hypothetical protein
LWLVDARKIRDTSELNPQNLLLGQVIVRQLEMHVPLGQYQFIIDAGYCGTFDNTQYLHSKQRRFLISVSKDQPSWLFSSFLHKGNIILLNNIIDLVMHANNWNCNDWNLGISIYTKKDSTSKPGNIILNIYYYSNC